MQVDLDVLPPLLAAGMRSVGVIGSSRRWRATRAELPARGEFEHPLTVRRPVALSSAIADGHVDIEGMVGVRATASEAIGLAQQDLVPVLVSPDWREVSDKALAAGGGVLEAVLTWRHGLASGTRQPVSAAAARPDRAEEEY
jgi:hypothetical protein